MFPVPNPEERRKVECKGVLTARETGEQGDHLALNMFLPEASLDWSSPLKPTLLAWIVGIFYWR